MILVPHLFQVMEADELFALFVPKSQREGFETGEKCERFYLLKHQSGDIDEIDSAMRIEVKRALWIPLEDAVLKLAYRGDRDVIRRAQEYLQNHPEV